MVSVAKVAIGPDIPFMIELGKFRVPDGICGQRLNEVGQVGENFRIIAEYCRDLYDCEFSSND